MTSALLTLLQRCNPTAAAASRLLLLCVLNMLPPIRSKWTLRVVLASARQTLDIRPANEWWKYLSPEPVQMGMA